MSDFDRFKGLNFTPLDQYKLTGKTIRGAFADLPNTRNRSWINQVLPELIWVALVRRELDMYQFADAFRVLAQQFADLGVMDVTLSEISLLDLSLKQQLIEIIASSDFMKRAVRPILLFAELLPDYDLWVKAIGVKVDYVNDVAILAETIAMTLDHQSQESTDCRWFRLMPMILARKIILPEEMRLDIIAYPNVFDMRHTRPSVRSLEITFEIKNKDSSLHKWCDDFWGVCFESTQCLIPSPNLAENDYSVDDYGDLISYHRKKISGIRIANEKHLPNIKLDVLTGAGLYALKILDELVDSPAKCGIVGRIAVRTLTELVINVTYLTDMKEDSLWDNFYFHGQGEAKKIFLKYMRKEERPAFIELSDIWLIANEVRFMDFLNINLGDWDDNNLRKRAIDSGLKDFYDVYYDWPSNYTHATWAAIRREVYTPCQNPLHKYHLLPSSEIQNDYGSVLAEALYLTKFILSNVYEVYSDLETHRLLAASVK